MANQWFRMYSEFATDPKVQSMSEAMQRRLTMVMCLRCSNVLATLQADELAFALRLSDEELAETKALFQRKGFIDDAWNLLNWDKRQFNSDSSTERSRKHRQRKNEGETAGFDGADADDEGNATLRNVAATPPDTETDTEQKKEPNGSSSTAKPSTVTHLPNCPHLQVLDLFAKHLPELPQPKAELWDGQRAKDLRARWKWLLTATKRGGERYATSESEALDWFDRFFAYVAKSDFLSGRSGKWTGCDLGWLVKAENFTKVVQGNYEHKEAA